MPEGYVRILFIESLPEVEREIIKLQAICDADGTPAQARVVRSAWVEALSSLEALSKVFAARFTVAVRDIQEATQVRPDTGLPPNERMNTYLKSDPLPALPGSVGVVNRKEIDDSPAFWWWTNEVGWAGNVGRVVHGLFYNANFSGRGWPASGAMSREHPLFRAMGPQPGSTQSGSGSPRDVLDMIDGMGGAGGGKVMPEMVIGNAIPARRFVLRAITELEPQWRGQVFQIKRKLETVVMAAMDEHAAILAQRAAQGRLT